MSTIPQKQPKPLPKDIQILTLSPQTLSTSPHFPPLFTLLNTAFDHHAQHGHPTKKFLHRGRFTAPADMISELGPDPQAFCMIAFEGPPLESEIIGSISAKPFVESAAEPGPAPDGHPRLLFKRPPPVNREQAVAREGAEGEGEGGAARWELLASAVALRVKGTGVASVLMEECVREIGRRVGGKGDGDGGGKKVVLYLSTLQELNEAYYLKRGWRTTGVRRFEAGTAGSRDAFSVVEMVRVV